MRHVTGYCGPWRAHWLQITRRLEIALILAPPSQWRIWTGTRWTHQGPAREIGLGFVSICWPVRR